MLLSLAIAPVLITLFYIYIRDKYEKEPIMLLIVGLIIGLIITFPIVFVANISILFLPQSATLMHEALFTAFLVSSFVEELFKYIVLFFLTWRNKNLNEKFDGIVYAVFISLGFAFVENILYVFSEDMGGISTAASRAIFSVPGHGIFGVYMGYFFTIAKFNRILYLPIAFIAPWLIHGTYNFILLSGAPFSLFIVFIIILWYGAFILMKNHLRDSPFKIL